MSKKRKKWITVICMSLSIFGVIWYLYSWEPKDSIDFQNEQFDALTVWVRTHKSPNVIAVQLPDRFSSLNSTGKAYITGDYIFIPTLFGVEAPMLMPLMFAEDDYCSGYVFIENNPSLYNDPDHGDYLTELEIYTPNYYGTCTTHVPTGVVKHVMYVGSQINSKWYVVDSYGL